MNWSEDRRWKDRIPTVYLETGKAPMKKLISRSRLVVHSYDSTGILEGLALNIPTLCFWNGGLDHVLPSAKPYYELLRAAGILADTPEQAALTVAQYWDNTDKWWKGEQVQKARRLFCEKYARAERHPVRTMKRLLMTSMLRKNN
jgi:putative transferase (TIGR04331 family)